MKFTVLRTDGTNNSGKKYLVVNVDEPYAGEVADMIEKEERRKGSWDHGDKSLREVMGINNVIDGLDNKLKPGDKVKMVNCYEARLNKYIGKVWTVESEPWDLCGTEVIKLEGKAGGFATKCLEKVKEAG